MILILRKDKYAGRNTRLAPRVADGWVRSAFYKYFRGFKFVLLSGVILSLLPCH